MVFFHSYVNVYQRVPSRIFPSSWWYTYPSEKYEFVSWDDDIPNIWKDIKFHGSSHHQPDIYIYIIIYIYNYIMLYNYTIVA